MPPQAIHATAVAIGGEALLIRGPSRAGKSRLAVALIARSTPGRPISLVGDDRILLHEDGGRLIARPHPRIAGFIERRGLGIVAMDWVEAAPVGGMVELGDALPSSASGYVARMSARRQRPSCDAGRQLPLGIAEQSCVPQPPPLRGISFSRKRAKEGLLHLPRLLLSPADADPAGVLAWWGARGAGATHLPHSAPASDWPCAKD